MNSAIPSAKYRPDIDGLRAIAVLSVIGFHAFPNYIQGGFIGVDLFFVISGFLISSLILVNLENNSFSFVDFFQRRIKRIFPALLVTLLFCAILGWFALFPAEYKQLGKHIASGAGFISNIVLWEETGYFTNTAETKPLLHLWSLGIEEQFYILWPLVLWLAWKKNFNLWLMTSFLVAASFILNVFFIHLKPIATFYFPLMRFWELLSGSLLAWFFLYKPQFLIVKLESFFFRNIKIINNLYSFLGVLLITYAIVAFSKDSLFPGFLAIVPVLGALFIILAGPQAWFNRAFLSNRIMIWFGLISFPLYLWHWPLLSFANIMEGGVPSERLRIIIVFISVFLAWCTYVFIEKPIRLGNKANAMKMPMLIVLMIAMAGFGVYLKLQGGISARFKNGDELSALRNISIHSKVEFINCSKLLPQFEPFQFDGGCSLYKNELPDIAFIGDSHTGHYREAIAKQFPNNSVLIIEQQQFSF